MQTNYQTLRRIVRDPRILPNFLIDSFKFFFRNKNFDPSQELIEQLKSLNACGIRHGRRNLFQHLMGTYRLLKQWNASENVCLAGLFHSIYSTQVFKKISVEFSQREKIQSIIGSEAEELVYYFCILDRKSFFSNLNRNNSFMIKNRFNNSEIAITEEQMKNLLEIHLANRLEQMIYDENTYRLKETFIKSKPFLSSKGYEAFLKAYKTSL